MEDCIFCKIVKGEIPSYTIYEDELLKVFLDINPTTNGHALIIPKKHYSNYLDLDDELVIQIQKVKKALYTTFKEKLNCKGITFVQNNDLGQDVKHFHIHAIPRYSEDNLLIRTNKKNLEKPEEIFNILIK